MKKIYTKPEIMAIEIASEQILVSPSPTQVQTGFDFINPLMGEEENFD